MLLRALLDMGACACCSDTPAALSDLCCGAAECACCIPSALLDCFDAHTCLPMRHPAHKIFARQQAYARQGRICILLTSEVACCRMPIPKVRIGLQARHFQGNMFLHGWGLRRAFLKEYTASIIFV